MWHLGVSEGLGLGGPLGCLGFGFGFLASSALRASGVDDPAHPCGDTKASRGGVHDPRGWPFDAFGKIFVKKILLGPTKETMKCPGLPRGPNPSS